MTDAAGGLEAPPAPSASGSMSAAPPARWPRRARWIAVAVLLALAALALWLALGHSRKTSAFRTESAQIFTALSGGNAKQVYDAASFRFQQTLLVDKFVDTVERMNQTMGAFKRVVAVLAVDRASTVAGPTARVQLELEFEAATVEGELSFLRGKDNQWRLLGMRVEIPPGLEKKAGALEKDGKRNEAPDAVIDQIKAIMEHVRAGEAKAIHEQASAAFRASMSLVELQAILDTERAEIGSFIKVLDILSSAQNEDRDRANVRALLEYEKAKTTGSFEFMRVGIGWQLLRFKVVVPEPFVPQVPGAFDAGEPE